jgi:hypothetical protein
MSNQPRKKREATWNKVNIQENNHRIFQKGNYPKIQEDEEEGGEGRREEEESHSV